MISRNFFRLCIYLLIVLVDLFNTEGSTYELMPNGFGFMNGSWKGDIFPMYVDMELRLYEAKDILFYATDTLLNQIIVEFEDQSTLVLKITVNDKVLEKTFDDICGCVFCKYERLRFKFQIFVNNRYSVECTGSKSSKVEGTFSKTDSPNVDFPVLEEDRENINSVIWLFNRPKFFNTISNKYAYPRNFRSRGCVTVRLEIEQIIIPLVFSTDSGIREGCNQSCNGNLTSQCGQGKCMERFSDDFQCSCNLVMNNGAKCVDKLRNNRSYSFNTIRFIRQVKLSFRFNTNIKKEKLMTMYGKKNKAQLIASVNNEKRLEVTYIIEKQNRFVGFEFPEYLKNKTDYILFIVLSKKYISILFHNLNQSTEVLKKEPFDVNLYQDFYFQTVEIYPESHYSDVAFAVHENDAVLKRAGDDLLEPLSNSGKDDNLIESVFNRYPDQKLPNSISPKNNEFKLLSKPVNFIPDQMLPNSISPKNNEFKLLSKPVKEIKESSSVWFVVVGFITAIVIYTCIIIVWLYLRQERRRKKSKNLILAPLISQKMTESRDATNGRMLSIDGDKILPGTVYSQIQSDVI